MRFSILPCPFSTVLSIESPPSPGSFPVLPASLYANGQVPFFAVLNEILEAFDHIIQEAFLITFNIQHIVGFKPSVIFSAVLHWQPMASIVTIHPSK